MKALTIIYGGDLISKAEIISAVMGYFPDRNIPAILNTGGEFSAPIEVDYEEEFTDPEEYGDDVVEDTTPEVTLLATYRIPAYYNDSDTMYGDLSTEQQAVFRFIFRYAGPHDDLYDFQEGNSPLEEIFRNDDKNPEPEMQARILVLLRELYQQYRRDCELPLNLKVSVYSDGTCVCDTQDEELMFDFNPCILRNSSVCNKINQLMAEPVDFSDEDVQDTAQAVRELVMASPKKSTLWAELDAVAQSEFSTLATQHNFIIDVNRYNSVEHALATLVGEPMYNDAVKIYNSWVARR